MKMHFLYFASVYKKLITENERLYGRTLVKIPTSKYVVFYNGPEKDMPEERNELRLSDAFEYPEQTHGFEWTATMININAGKNAEIMRHCRRQEDYSTLVSRIKENAEQMDLGEAIDRAVSYCIQNDVLKDILETHQKEVKDMCLTEFDEKKYTEIIREESREEGRLEGRQEGRQEGIILNRIDLIHRKIVKGVSAEQCAEILEEDLEFVKRIYRIYEAHPDMSNEEVYRSTTN